MRGARASGMRRRRAVPKLHARDRHGQRPRTLQRRPDGLPLYEGRMVWQFDHRAKGYRSGRGRAAVWEPSTFDDPPSRSSRSGASRARSPRRPRSGPALSGGLLRRRRAPRPSDRLSPRSSPPGRSAATRCPRSLPRRLRVGYSRLVVRCQLVRRVTSSSARRCHSRWRSALLTACPSLDRRLGTRRPSLVAPRCTPHVHEPRDARYWALLARDGWVEPMPRRDPGRDR